MEKKYKIGIYLNAFFTLVGIIACIQSLVGSNGGYTVHVAVADLVLFALIIYYTATGYKKPHGNLLKGLMIAFALSLLFSVLTAAKYDTRTNLVMIPIAMSFICYIAGRLDRIHQNKYLMCVVLVLLVHIAFRPIIGFDLGFSANHTIMSKIFIWLDLCSAYFLRFKLHKEAGLLDRVKK